MASPGLELTFWSLVLLVLLDLAQESTAVVNKRIVKEQNRSGRWRCYRNVSGSVFPSQKVCFPESFSIFEADRTTLFHQLLVLYFIIISVDPFIQTNQLDLRTGRLLVG
jgi:hypothetical protein